MLHHQFQESLLHRAILQIAEGYGGDPVPISAISESQEISGKYLEQVVSPLRRAGLVTSQKGVKGGYVLSRTPAEITLWDVISALDAHPHLVECVDDPDSCGRTADCVAHKVWHLLDSKLRGIWGSFTLENLLAESAATPPTITS